MQTLQIGFVRRIMRKKFLRQAHGAQRQCDDLFDVSFFREREFATASAQIHQQELWRRRAQTGDHAQVNQPAFFKSSNDFKVPAGGGLDPFGKEPGIVAVTQGAGADHARTLHSKTLHGAMKTAHDFKGLGHGLGIEIAVTKNAFTQPRNFTVLMQREPDVRGEVQRYSAGLSWSRYRLRQRPACSIRRVGQKPGQIGQNEKVFCQVPRPE